MMTATYLWACFSSATRRVLYSTIIFRSILPRSQGRNLVSNSISIHKSGSLKFPLNSYIIERLPEGGEGLHGYDDGEGDD
jgi:hypothetical protein